MARHIMDTAVPFVKSWLPWLGHGVDFGKDADKMLANLQQQHGDEFTVVLGGRKITFLLNPHDYPAFVKQAKTLRSDDIAMEISAKTFGIDWDKYSVGLHELTEPFNKILQRGKLGPLTESMHKKLDEHIFAKTTDQWQEGMLFRFVAKLIFDAGGEALIGDGIFEDESLFDEFLHFDSQFPLLITGLPRWLFFRRSDRFLKKMYRLMDSPNPNQSAVMDTRFDSMRDVTTVDEMGRNNAGLFWATQANTVVMAFYSVFYILRDPEARAEILNEVQDVLGNAPEKTENGSPVLSLGVIDKLVKLDACLDEVMRLKTAPMPIRIAKEDVEIELVSGRKLVLKKGDYASLYPRITHMNPDIYDAPEEFVWDRFLGKQGPNKFTYRGTPVKYCLLPFGAGMSICPGRHFARNEFKVLAAVLLYQMDIELLETAMPEFDKSRSGLGALTPVSDIPFKYRFRKAGDNGSDRNGSDRKGSGVNVSTANACEADSSDVVSKENSKSVTEPTS